MDTDFIVSLICIILLLFFSAFLSASKAAYKASGLPDKDESEVDRTTAALAIWNIFANVALIVIGLYFMYRFINFSHIPVWSFVSRVVVLLALILICCEILPKYYGQRFPRKFVSRLNPLYKILEVIVRPLSSLMIKSRQSLAAASKKKANDMSVGELSKALELTSEDLTEEKEMLEGIIGLYSKTTVEIMTPRMDVAYLPYSAKFKEVIDYIVEVSYSRIPVYGEGQDDIKGILYIKDLLPYLSQANDFHWQKLIRQAFYVPEAKKIDELLEEFRANKIHLAVVVDEFGGTSGIVTMEDILEEIVGDISDEYDEEEDEKCIITPEGDYICDARTLLNDFFKTTDIDPKTFGKLTDEIDTLGGLVLEIKEDFPEEGETVRYENYAFKVLEMDNKRILKIKFSIDELKEAR